MKKNLMNLRYGIPFFLCSLFLSSFIFVTYAATAGLPFTEDFSATNLQDTNNTNTNWNTTSGQVTLNNIQRNFGGFEAGSFTSSNISADTPNSSDIELADLNGDTFLDAIVAVQGAENRIYLHNGTDDPFNGVAGSNLHTDTFSSAVLAIGDVDRDGDIDIFVGESAHPNHLYLNDGTGTFTAATFPTEDERTDAIALYDINNDGWLDALVGNDTGELNRYYLNNQTADPFAAATQGGFAGNTEFIREFKAIDIDNDNDLDILAATTTGLTSKLFINDGANPPSFTQLDLGTDTDFSLTLDLGDLDNDGNIDVVLGNSGVVNRYYLNDGDANPFDAAGVSIHADARSTRSIHLEDIDNDGDLDAITADSSSTNAVYLNNGSSNPFSNSIRQNIGTSQVTQASAIGDLDKDGDIDQVETNFGQVSRLYLNTSSTNPFQDVSETDLTADTFGSTVSESADFNRDGNLDVVLGTFSTEEIKIYLGNGDGTFGASANVSADTDNNQDFEIVDLDNDGNLDLIVANEDQTNKYYLGNGDGTFAAGVEITADADSSQSIDSGDLDGDGDLDLVVSNRFEVNKVYLNDGVAPFFETSANVSADNDQSYKGILADMNRDGNLDYVIGAGINVQNRLHLGNGDGTFAASTFIDNTSKNTATILVRDIEGDGDLDVISINHLNLNEVSINDGAGDPFDTFQKIDIPGFSSIAPRAIAEDFDSDGDIDIIITRPTTNAIVSLAPRLLLNDGDDNPFDSLGYIELPSTVIFGIHPGDFNNDGHIDFIGTRSLSTNKVYLNNGFVNPFAPITASDLNTETYSSYALQTTDIDHDGDLDLIEGILSGVNRYYLNNGTEDPFSGVASQLIGAESNATTDIAFGDINRDGYVDLVIANSSASVDQIYFNNQSSSPFTGVIPNNVSSDTLSSREVELGDVDNDGDLDIVIASLDSENKLYLNNGDGTFAAGLNISTETDSTSAIALADVNHDGLLDLITGNGFNSNIVNRLTLNDGTGNPFDGVPQDIGTAAGTDVLDTSRLIVEDFNNDGYLDLLVANADDISAGGTAPQSNRLYLNDGDGTPFNVASTAVGSDQITYSLVARDINQDGKMDIVEGGVENGFHRIILNDGTGDPFDNAEIITPPASGTGLVIVEAADFNGNGDLEEITANFSILERNQLYKRSALFSTNIESAQSIRVDAETTDILNATLTATESLSESSFIDYFLSNDGGSIWHKVVSGSQFTFPSGGLDLRWRAELKSYSPLSTPTLSNLTISTDRPSSGGGRRRHQITFDDPNEDFEQDTTETTQGSGGGGSSGSTEIPQGEPEEETNFVFSAPAQPRVVEKCTQDIIFSPDGMRSSRQRLLVRIKNKDVLMKDIPFEEWYAVITHHAVKQNIMQGFADNEGNPTGIFKPNNPVTYSQIAKMVTLAANIPISNSTINSPNQDHWSAVYFDTLSRNNITTFNGISASMLESPAPRGFVMLALANAFELETNDDPLGTIYDDLPADHPLASVIEKLTELCIVGGDGGKNTIRPEANINRSEAATMVLRMQRVMKDITNEN